MERYLMVIVSAVVLVGMLVAAGSIYHKAQHAFDPVNDVYTNATK